MSMTVMVLRALPDRWRGFLQSVSLEIGVGVFVAPNMRPAVRERIWAVARDWFAHQDGGSFLMVWTQAGEIRHRALGDTPRRIWHWDGVAIATMSCNSEPEHNRVFESLTTETET